MWVYALWRFADRKLSIPIITPSNSLLNVLLPSLQHPSLTYSTWYHRPKSRNWSHHITPHTSVLLISMYHTSFGSSRHINQPIRKRTRSPPRREGPLLHQQLIMGLQEALVPDELLDPLPERANRNAGDALAPPPRLVVGPVVHQEVFEVRRREHLDRRREDTGRGAGRQAGRQAGTTQNGWRAGRAALDP